MARNGYLLAPISFLFLIVAHIAVAQEPVKLTYLPQSITFDGNVEDAEWADVEPVPLIQHLPVYGAEPTEKTELRLAYDDDYLYLSGRMFHENPDNMQNTTKKRDAMVGSTEYLGLIIDSFNDNENALSFFTTPAGLRFDATIFNDAEGDFPLNLSWNTFWDVKVIHTDYGWQAEIRVPFSSLRFQNTDGLVNMGLSVQRYMPHKNEVSVYPPINNNLGPWSSWKPSRMQKVVLERVKPRKPVYLAPYVLAGYQEQNELNDEETEYIHDEDLQFNMGLDLKYSLTSNITMDITANPDFAQVEVDDQQVNLTRFSLFFPEKRLFFQERSSVFNFNMGGPNNLFYSRRIGIEEDGLVDIYGGVRVVGRAGKWDFGMIDMQTANQLGYLSTNYGVIRARRQVINPFSYVGGIVTNKIDEEGNFNTNAGIDGVFRVSTNDYVNINFAQSYYNGTADVPFKFDDAKLRVLLERRITKGFAYQLDLNMAGKGYNPELGFELRENYYRIGNFIRWGWVPGPDKKILNHNISMRFWEVRKNVSHLIESGSYGPQWEFNSKNNWYGNFSLLHNVENLVEPFELSDDVTIPIGKYRFNTLNVSVITPYSNLLNFENSLVVGQFFDGTQMVLGVSPSLQIGSSIELGINYFYNRINFSERPDFEVHLARFRTTYMFSTKLSFDAFVQHNSGNDYSFGNFRLRFNPREGNDLFIVYNTGVNSNRRREIPHLPRLESRTFVVKYTYTFVLSKK